MAVNERKHVSLHIEKTGGITVKKFLVDLYGPKRVFFYNAVGAGFYRADSIRGIWKTYPTDQMADKFVAYASLINGILPTDHFLSPKVMYGDKSVITAARLPDDWMGVHGHFGSDMFDDLVEDPFRTVVLRDPLGRTISQFIDWKQSRGLTNWRSNITFDPTMSFRDFALLEGIENFQSKVLGEIPIEDFDIVGVTEDIEGFIRRVVLARGGNPDKFSSAHLNQSLGKIKPSDLGVDASFTKKFISRNGQDYANYYKARRLCGLDPS